MKHREVRGSSALSTSSALAVSAWLCGVFGFGYSAWSDDQVPSSECSICLMNTAQGQVMPFQRDGSCCPLLMIERALWLEMNAQFHPYPANEAGEGEASTPNGSVPSVASGDEPLVVEIPTEFREAWNASPCVSQGPEALTSIFHTFQAEISRADGDIDTLKQPAMVEARLRSLCD